MWPCPSSGSWPQAADACPPTVTPGSRVPLAVLDEALGFPYGEMCPFSTWVLLFRSSSHFYFYHSKGGENADARGPHRSAPGPGRRGFAHWAGSLCRVFGLLSVLTTPAQRHRRKGRQVTSWARVSPFEVMCGRSFLYRLFPQPCFSVTFCG